jgi:hypothetical protein
LLLLSSLIWVPQPRHQQQRRLLKPLLLSSLGSWFRGHVINNSSGCKSCCHYPLWALLSITSTRGWDARDGRGDRRAEGDVHETAPPVERYVAPITRASPHEVHAHVN